MGHLVKDGFTKQHFLPLDGGGKVGVRIGILKHLPPPAKGGGVEIGRTYPGPPPEGEGFSTD